MFSFWFKSPGFANSLVLRIGLLILLALGAFTFGLYELVGRQTLDRLGETQLRLAAEQVEARYLRMRKGVETTLHSSQAWAMHGDQGHFDLAEINDFFFPILANHGEINSVLLAHESGREILVLYSGGKWVNRVSNPAEWGQHSYWVTWRPDRQVEKVEMRAVGYDARQRPWYQGGAALPDGHGVHWTAPYVFFTTKLPGISAAKRWTGRDGKTLVIAHDVQLSDIVAMTTHLSLGQRGQVALMQGDGKLVLPPKDPRFEGADALQQALLKTPAELGMGELATAFQAASQYQAAHPEKQEVLGKFSRPDGVWLSFFRHLGAGENGVWLGAVAPEADFNPVTGWELAQLGFIAFLALGLGVAVAVRIARGFGQPLMGLQASSQRIGQLELEQPVSTDAPWREVQALATSLETMRQHLQRAGQDLREANSDLEQKVEARTRDLALSQQTLAEREAYFRAIFDHAAVAIASLSPTGRLTRVNQAFAEFLGQPFQVLIATPENHWLAPGELARFNEALASLTEGRAQSFRSEFEFAHGKGSSRWGDVQLTAVHRPGGGVDSLLMALVDVSDRREMEAVLVRQFSLMQALLDALPSPVFYKGPDTRFLGCNTAYEQFFGVDRQAFIGKRVLDLEYLPEAARQAYQAEDEAVIAACGRASHEIPMIRADGATRDTLYAVSGFLAPDGTPGGLIGVVVDITAQKEAERVAAAAAAAKADFLANMSHEIRTPMNAILGMTHLALQTELTERQRNYLSKVDTAAKGLLAIINDILDLSKIEAGMMRVERTRFSLEASLRNLADLSTLKARERGLELLFDMAPDVPDALVGDPLRLGQILLNLVGNAIKFTEQGEVRLAVHRQDGAPEGALRLVFEVVDTGIGIDEAQQAVLFQAFSQADTSTTRKYGGTGLGLSICKRLVDLLGGDIRVESRPGEGSRFTVTLDFAEPEAGEVLPAPRLGLPAELLTLVVDDSAGAREIFRNTLHALGLDCDVAEGGEAALEVIAAAAKPFDLLILDWKMPGMDGVTLLRRLRAEGTAPAAVVMATAYDPEDLEAALAGEPVGAILTKPATPSALFDSLVSALNPASRRKAMVAPPKPGKVRFAGQRVLLVEDNEVNLELAQEMLEGMGLTVETAENGALAVECVQDRAFDLVLMDCQMPVMDGYEATRYIRQQLGRDRLPIVAMTANALPSDKEHCLLTGMNDHVAKPIDVAVLQDTLARWLGSPQPMPDGPAEGLAGLPDSPDWDCANALARLGGNRASYDRLLKRFRENQSDVMARLEAACARGDRQAMILDTHTLKGLAGNIGAVTLAAVAAELEAELKACEALDPAIWPKRLAVLQKPLADVLRIAENDSKAMPMAQVSVVPSSDQQAAQLDHLQALLEADDGDAGRYFEAQVLAWLTQVSPTSAEALSRLIRRYDLEAAAACLVAFRSGESEMGREES